MKHRFTPSLPVAVALAVAAPLHAGDLEVFQGLDEATRRIARLDDKPADQLIGGDGFYQSETLIFNDTETGHEVWSLTMEKATDLANIERRNVFSADGSVVSMKGNRIFRNADGQVYKTNWAGHNFLMEADVTNRRKLWVTLDGKPTQFNGKFDTWSRLTPRRLYYVVNNALYRVDVGHGLFDNPATLLYRFPNDSPKTLQNISDNDILVVQDVNGEKPDDAPLFYVIDTKRDPADPLFVRSRSFNLGGLEGIDGHDPRNEFHVHVILIDRDGEHVGWNYGSATDVGEYLHFSLPLDDFDGMPTYRSQKVDPWGQYLSHPGVGPGDRIAYLGGPAKPDENTKVGGWGIWARQGKDKSPVYIGGPVSGGHANWDSFDPDWFVVNPNLGWPDKPLSGTIIAGSPDPTGDMAGKNSKCVVLARAWDHRRGGRAGFDALPRPSQSPDATKVWFHSSMLMPDDTFTGSYIVVFRRPYAPTQLSHDGRALNWTPHFLSHETRSWIVYRRAGDEWVAVAEVPRDQTSWVVAKAGTYMVTALEGSGLESDVSSPTVDTAGGKIGKPVEHWDATPPPAPTGFAVDRAAPGRNRLTWDAAASSSAAAGGSMSDLRYFNLYFSDQGPPDPVQANRFASPPAGTSDYLDWTAPAQGAGFYAVTAVDRQGNESAPMRAQLDE